MIDKNIIIFLTQFFVMSVIIIASIINLSLHNEPKDVWLGLISLGLGIIIPTPSIKAPVTFPSSS